MLIRTIKCEHLCLAITLIISSFFVSALAADDIIWNNGKHHCYARVYRGEHTFEPKESLIVSTWAATVVMDAGCMVKVIVTSKEIIFEQLNDTEAEAILFYGMDKQEKLLYHQPIKFFNRLNI